MEKSTNCICRNLTFTYAENFKRCVVLVIQTRDFYCKFD